MLLSYVYVVTKLCFYKVLEYSNNVSLAINKQEIIFYDLFYENKVQIYNLVNRNYLLITTQSFVKDLMSVKTRLHIDSCSEVPLYKKPLQDFAAV
jgi:hypothetical protein